MRQHSIWTDEAGLSDAKLAKEVLKVSHFDPFCVITTSQSTGNGQRLHVCWSFTPPNLRWFHGRVTKNAGFLSHRGTQSSWIYVYGMDNPSMNVVKRDTPMTQETPSHGLWMSTLPARSSPIDPWMLPGVRSNNAPIRNRRPDKTGARSTMVYSRSTIYNYMSISMFVSMSMAFYGYIYIYIYIIIYIYIYIR